MTVTALVKSVPDREGVAPLLHSLMMDDSVSHLHQAVLTSFTTLPQASHTDGRAGEGEDGIFLKPNKT